MILAALTKKERLAIQSVMLREEEKSATSLEVWRNDDGTWACDVLGQVFESHSLGGIFRELASIVEAA